MAVTENLTVAWLLTTARIAWLYGKSSMRRKLIQINTTCTLTSHNSTEGNEQQLLYCDALRQGRSQGRRTRVLFLPSTLRLPVRF
jgi:hypothetical protein